MMIQTATKPVRRYGIKMPAIDIELDNPERTWNRQHKKVRIMLKTNFCCAYCGFDFLGSSVAFALMTIDHIVPRSKDGPNDIGNCVAACTACNRIKADVKAESVEEGKRIVSSRAKQFDEWLRVAKALRDLPEQQVASD